MFVSQSVKSQNIICDVDVVVFSQRDSLFEISDKTVDYIFFGIYPTEVTQTLYFPENIGDSLILQLEYLSPLNQVLSEIFYHNLTVNCEIDNELKPLPFIFNGESIVIQKIYKTTKIIINYQYQSDFPIRNAGKYTLFFMQPHISGWHSWFFTCKNMKLEQVEFVIQDDSAYFFATHTQEKFKNHYFTQTDKVNHNDFSFYLLKKSYYDTVKLEYKTVSADLYFNKGGKIDTVSYLIDDTLKYFSCIQPHKNNIAKKQKVSNYVYASLQKIIDFFEWQDTLALHIADAHLYFEDADSAKYAWGMGTKCSDKSFFLFVDTSFWNTKDLTHEIIHAFNK